LYWEADAVRGTSSKCDQTTAMNKSNEDEDVTRHDGWLHGLIAGGLDDSKAVFRAEIRLLCRPMGRATAIQR
jgi:hypothetical protein